MRPLRRFVGLLVLTLAFVTLAFFLLCPESLAEPKPKQLVIGYQGFPTPEILLKDQGWAEDALGIPIKWIEFDSGMHVAQVMASGNVDIGLVGTSPCAAGIARGFPIEAIWIHDIIGDNEALLARQSSGINSVQDLIGKTVAVPFGSTTHYHLMVALRLEHMNPAEMNILYLEPRTMLAAWQKGEIDAGFIWEPTLTKMLDSGGSVVLTSRQLTERGFPTGDICVLRKEFGEKYPGVVVDYLKSLDRAVQYWRDKPDETARAISRQLGMSVEEAARQMKKVMVVSGKEQSAGKHLGGVYWNFGLYTLLKETADFLVQAGAIKSAPPRDVFLKGVNAAYLVRATE